MFKSSVCFPRSVRSAILLTIWILSTALFYPRVFAQNAGAAYLFPPHLDHFPQVETDLFVIDSTGNFVYGLTSTEIKLLEDGKLLPLKSLELLRPGIQAVVAINPGTPFAIQNNQGLSRYDYILQAIKGWAASRAGSTIDDLSHLTTSGTSTSHTHKPAEFASTLSADSIDARKAIPTMDTLSRAVDLASDPTPRGGMGRAILFITAPMDVVSDSVVENIISKANLSNTHISVWLVAPPGSASSDLEAQFVKLAQRTGGSYWLYSGDEQFPSIDAYFEPHRNIYRLAYDSELKTSGNHTLTARINSQLGQFTSQSQSFELDIQPLLPVFVMPPIQILRNLSESGKNLSGGEDVPERFLPTGQNFSVIFDFPDRHPRQIVRSSLYVDGLLTEENTVPPFNEFHWNIGNYIENGSHRIQIEAQDILGLVGRSIELPVEIKIVRPQPESRISVYKDFALESLSVFIPAGLFMLIVLVLGKQVLPYVSSRYHQDRILKDEISHQSINNYEPGSRPFQFWSNQLLAASQDAINGADAFLERNVEEGELSNIAPVPICLEEILIGNDPDQADLVLKDPSLEGLHARIWRDLNGDYYLADYHSIAGTRIDMKPVSSDGLKLRHGDLVYFGKAGFRFILKNPAVLSDPSMQYLD